MKHSGVVFISVAWGINVLAFSIVYPFLSIYLHTVRGFPMSRVGLIFPVMGLATILGSPAAGWLTDRFGPRVLMIAGPAGRCAGFFFLAWMAYVQGPFWGFVVGLFIVTFLGKFFQTASNAYISGLTESLRLDAFNKIHVGGNIGWMIGPALGAFLARTPYSLMFSITAVLCLGTAAINMIFGTNKHGQSQGESCMKSLSSNFLRQFLIDGQMCVLTVLAFCLFLSVSQFATTLSIYATAGLNFTKTALGFLYTINGALVIVFMMPVNKALSGCNKCLRISAGAFLYVLAFLGFGMGSEWHHLAVSMTVMTFGEILCLTALLSLISGIAPSGMVGRYMGVHGLVEGLGWAMGPYIGSIMFDNFYANGFLLWSGLATFAGIAGAGFLLMYFRLK